MKSILGNIDKIKKRHFIHAALLIILASVSIYSVCSVVSSYLYQDSVTTVSVIPLDNIAPLVKYLSINYEVANNTIFPETWPLAESDLAEVVLRKDIMLTPQSKQLRSRLNLFYSNYSAGKNMTVKNMIDIAAVNAFIHKLDIDFALAAAGDRVILESGTSSSRDISDFFSNLTVGLPGFASGFREISDGVYASDVGQLVDQFLENPHSKSIVDKTIAHVVGPDFARLISAALPNTTYLQTQLFVDLLDVNSLQVSIPLDFLGNVQEKRFVVGLVPFKDWSATPLFSGVFYKFTHSSTKFVAGLLPGNEALTGPTVYLELSYQNNGVYNSTETNSDCSICNGLTTVEECKLKCTIASVSDLCHCIPFTFRRLFPSDPKLDKLPYCTVRTYGKCLRSIEYNPRQCAEKRLIPCVIHDSERKGTGTGFLGKTDRLLHEFLLEKAGDFDLIGENEKYRLYVSLGVDQKTYVLFQESYQTTLMQTFGLIGGNLGMFLSFSLYGTWQIAVFFFLTYVTYRKKANGNVVPPATGPGVATTWLRLAKQNMNAKPDRRIQQDETKRQMEDLCSEMKEVNSRCEILKQRILEYKS